MKGYYCVTPNGREFFYIPSVIFGVRSTDPATMTRSYKFVYRSKLKKLGCLINKGKLSKERLENRGWQVDEIYIPRSVRKEARFFREIRDEPHKFKYIRMECASILLSFLYESVNGWCEEQTIDSDEDQEGWRRDSEE